MFSIALTAYASATVSSSLVRTAFEVSSKNYESCIIFGSNDRKITIDNKLVIGALSVLFSPITEPFFWYSSYKCLKEGPYELKLEYKYPKK